jgi:hypothetical protein
VGGSPQPIPPGSPGLASDLEDEAMADPDSTRDDRDGSCRHLPSMPEISSSVAPTGGEQRVSLLAIYKAPVTAPYPRPLQPEFKLLCRWYIVRPSSHREVFYKDLRQRQSWCEIHQATALQVLRLSRPEGAPSRRYCGPKCQISSYRVHVHSVPGCHVSGIERDLLGRARCRGQSYGPSRERRGPGRVRE